MGKLLTRHPLIITQLVFFQGAPPQPKRQAKTGELVTKLIFEQVKIYNLPDSF